MCLGCRLSAVGCRVACARAAAASHLAQTSRNSCSIFNARPSGAVTRNVAGSGFRKVAIMRRHDFAFFTGEYALRTLSTAGRQQHHLSKNSSGCARQGQIGWYHSWMGVDGHSNDCKAKPGQTTVRKVTRNYDETHASQRKPVRLGTN